MVPDYQTLMLPLLRLTSDREDHRTTDLVEALAEEFHLSQTDRDALLSSGQRTLFNRTHWAVTYLSKAGLIDRTGRGVIRITNRGRQVVSEPPAKIDVKYLSQFPEFKAFRARATPPAPIEPTAEAAPQTPDELLDSTYEALRRSIEADLLDRVIAAPPVFFEKLVLDLLMAMGFGGSQGAGRHVGRSGDEGIDGVIDQDQLGLDAVYIQAKRWKPDHPVSRPDLHQFTGSLDGQRATKGVFITTSRFTNDAREYAGRASRRMVLIDGSMLARLMYDYSIGVRQQQTYEVRRVDTAYFEGEA